MARTSKNLKAAYAEIDRNKAYPLAEAVTLIKKNARSKFDETIRMPKRIIAPPNHTFGPGSSPQKVIAINTAKMGVRR